MCKFYFFVPPSPLHVEKLPPPPLQPPPPPPCNLLVGSRWRVLINQRWPKAVWLSCAHTKGRGENHDPSSGSGKQYIFIERATRAGGSLCSPLIETVSQESSVCCCSQFPATLHPIQQLFFFSNEGSRLASHISLCTDWKESIKKTNQDNEEIPK